MGFFVSIMDFLSVGMEMLADLLMSMPVQLLSAIFIFLFGLHFLSEGLKNATQDKLKSFFDKAIKNRVFGAIFGTIITGIIQSSTAVTVMTIGFVNAGLMTLIQAASVIVGANVGTTLTGHMMTIRFDAFTPMLMIIGGLLFLFVKKEKSRGIGVILFGFGLFFLGLSGMSDAMRPLRDSYVFRNAIASIEGRMFLGIIIGAIMTAILQSSTASKAIIIVLAMDGVIDLNIAIPLIFGMNIGTCFTALLSSVSANKNAKRAALFHLLFSLIGTAIFLPFVSQFTTFIEWIGGYTGIQVANAHTFFNIMTALVILPFISHILRLINLMVKDDDQVKEYTNPLDERFLENPAIAFDQAFKESLGMYELAIGNLELSTDALLTGEVKQLKKLYANEKKLNRLEHDISAFLIALPPHHTHEADMSRVASIIKVTNDIERIGDHAKNIAEAAKEMKDNTLSFSEAATAELKEMLSQTKKTIQASYESYEKTDVMKANLTAELEDEVDALEESLRDQHIERLNKRVCDVRSGAVFLDVISNFERIGDHAVNISELILKTHGNG